MRKLVLLFLVIKISFGTAQKLPSTNLFLFDLTQRGTTYNVSNPKWLNQFNPKGYNNQPSFMTDDEVYVSVQMPWDTTQTDIYSINISTFEFLPITNTPESEYSPKKIPNSNDFSVVRVDVKDKKNQRLWKYPMSRTDNGEEVLKYYQNVGYYHWCSPDKLFMFMIGSPENFYQLTTLTTESTIHFPYLPGRCFQSVGNKVAYIDKTEEDEWKIKLLDPSNSSSEIVVRALNQSEDFVVLNDGTYLMGKGSSLYQFKPKKDQDWIEIADLKNYGINKIERIAVNSKGKIIFVTK